MNRENIKRVRDHIAGLPPERLWMERFLSAGHSVADVNWTAGRLLKDCGTCGCIAGWTAAIFAPRVKCGGVEARAAESLGIPEEDASALFYPELSNHMLWGDIGPAHAVRVLDHLLETGKVDWSVAGEP